MSITLCLVKVKITVNRFHFTAEFPLFLKQMHSLKPVRWEISLVAQTFTTGCRFCKLKLKKFCSIWNPILFRLNKLKQHAEFFFTVYRHKKFNLGLFKIRHCIRLPKIVQRDEDRIFVFFSFWWFFWHWKSTFFSVFMFSLCVCVCGISPLHLIFVSVFFGECSLRLDKKARLSVKPVISISHICWIYSIYYVSTYVREKCLSKISFLFTLPLNWICPK